MNTGQMLLTIVAVLLLGLTVITVNSTFSQHGMVLEKTEVGVYATSLATSLIQEATGRSFDEMTVDTVVNSTTDLTLPANLGPESGEVYPAFDDFDDYNGLVRTVDVQGTDVFTVWSTVSYVVDDHPNSTSTNRTYHKRIDIAVAGSSSADTIRMSSIFSYWSFR
jgi:MSHA pilin protein MshD